MEGFLLFNNLLAIHDIYTFRHGFEVVAHILSVQVIHLLVADGSGGNNVFNACGFVVAKVDLGPAIIAIDDKVGAQALDDGVLLPLTMFPLSITP